MDAATLSAIQELAARGRELLELGIAAETATDSGSPRDTPSPRPPSRHPPSVTQSALCWLLRLAALKMLEARGGPQETTSRGLESCGSMRLPGNEPSPATLAQIAEVLDAEALKDAWSPGNEETLGWIYQSFHEPELAAALHSARGFVSKIPSGSIAASTRLYTPRWVVRYLVENTLGRLWLELHPDSGIARELGYLAPVDTDGPLPHRARLVRDIRFLDPACGTMHFGLCAFDLFVLMYKDELAHAGRPGWPDAASVSTESEIPAAILTHNLYGVDIDPVALSIAEFSLWLRARALNPDAEVGMGNLLCSTPEPFLSDRMTRFLGALRDTNPALVDVLTLLRKSVRRMGQTGALFRLSEDTRALLLTKCSRLASIRGVTQPAVTGGGKETHLPDALWTALVKETEQALASSVEVGPDGGTDTPEFTRQLLMALRFLRLTCERFDVVATNPPYLTNRKLDKSFKDFLTKEYNEGRRDLYAAFMQRCVEFAEPDGRVGMLTMHSFMFITSYGKLRAWVLERASIESMVHLGPGLFPVGNPDTLQTTAFVLTRKEAGGDSDNCTGIGFRLVREKDGPAKQAALEQALSCLMAGKQDSRVHRFTPHSFKSIPGNPWVYWVSDEVATLFESLPALGRVGCPRQGIATSDNSRFVRFWWEVGKDRIGFGMPSIAAAHRSGKVWFPYMKSGGFQRWYGMQEHVIAFDKPHFDILSKVGNTLPSRSFYFRSGITYSYLTGARFSARLSPGGFIFDVAGSSLFPENIPFVLAVLNSPAAAHFLKLINPTVNFQVGDLRRVPVPKRSSQRLEQLCNQVTDLARDESRETETSFEFVAPPLWPNGLSHILQRRDRIANLEDEINEEVWQLYGISATERQRIEAELGAHGGSGRPRADETECRRELARQWVSYAAGMALGRFLPGVDGALGCGRFHGEVARRLVEMSNQSNYLVQDAECDKDLAKVVIKVLSLALGSGEARQVVLAATGRKGESENILRTYLPTGFYRSHLSQYRKRPVYWLLQSPRKKCGVWVFHERMTMAALASILDGYLKPRISAIERRLAEPAADRQASDNRRRRMLLNDCLTFAERMEQTLAKGYGPHVDDGVLVNAAPLWELLPAWQTEPKRVWQALQRGGYSWSARAMQG